MENKALDVFDPLFVTGFVLAIGRDFACLFLLGAIIPVVGQVIAASVFIFVLLVEAFFAFAISPRLQHFAPKLILLGIGILPVPLAGTIALLLAIVTQNRLVELLLTQLAIQAVAVATGGAGELLEGAALAEGGLVETGQLLEEGLEEGAKLAKKGVEAVEKAEEKSGVRKIGEAAERRLREHETDLRKELGEKEKEEGPSAEEVFGIKEPTEQKEELFEPKYEAQPEEEASEIELRHKFEAQKQKETEERRRAEYGGRTPLPIPRPPQERKEVELEQAA